MAGAFKPRPSLDKREASDQRGLSRETVEQIKAEILGLKPVGYKNPPRHTRFKKGQSRNPKGRPKKADDIGPGGDRSITNIILKEAARKVTIREGDETKEIPAIEAVIRAQHVSAIRGNSAYAQKHIIERYDRAEREQRRERNESVEFWTDYKERASGLFADAEKEGEPPPDILPHPDDVVIDHEQGVRIIGPGNREEAAELERTIKLRDLLLKQHALEVRLADDPDGTDRPGTARIFADIFNLSIPPRLRLSDLEMEMRLWTYQGIPKRGLLKIVRQEWRQMGARHRRGWTLPPLRWGKKLVTTLLDMGSEVLSGEGDGTRYIEPLSEILLEGFGRREAE